MHNVTAIESIRRCATRTFPILTHGLLLDLCLVVLIVPPTLLNAASAQGQTSAATPDVRVSHGMVASGEEMRFARATQAEFAEDVAALSLVPSAEVRLDRINDRVSVATGMAAAPAARRPGAYAQRRSVYAVNGGRHEIARTDFVASYEHDLVTLEWITVFAGDFDELSGKGTRLAGTEIRRTIEVETPGLQALLDSAVTGVDPERMAEMRNQLEVDASAAVQTVTVTKPDGTSKTYAADDPSLADAVGRGAGVDCVGNCFSDNGFAISAATIACVVAGLVGCGIVCVVTAGVACGPCIGGAVSACGVLATGGGIIGCIIDCAFGGGPPQPTPTPNFSSCSQSSLSDYYSCGAARQCEQFNQLVGNNPSAANCLSSAASGAFRSISCRTERPFRPTSCSLSSSASLTLATTLVTCLRETVPFVLQIPAILLGEQCSIALAQLDAARIIPPTFTPTPTPTFTPKPTLTPTPSSCSGDCNADGRVTVDELLRGLSMALASSANESCTAFDRNRDDRVGIDEVVGAVHSALTGCGSVMTRAELMVASTGSDRVLIYDLENGNRLDSLRVDDGGFFQPRGVAVGPDGDVYVGVTSSGTEDAVVRFDRATGIIDTVVRPNSGRVIRPEGLAFGPEGDLYVGSRNLGYVQTFDGTSGDFIQSAATVFEPRGLTFGPADGLMYVISANEVRRFDRTARVDLGAFIASGSGGLRTDTGSSALTFGPDGNLYVSSAGTDSVLRYDGQTGTFLDEFVSAGSGGLDNPVGLAFGPDARLYVASSSTDSVLRYDGRTGEFIDEFVPSGNGGLQQPTYLTVTVRSE
jgi:WD40 repeat protein